MNDRTTNDLIRATGESVTLLDEGRRIAAILAHSATGISPEDRKKAAEAAGRAHQAAERLHALTDYASRNLPNIGLGQLADQLEQYPPDTTVSFDDGETPGEFLRGDTVHNREAELQDKGGRHRQTAGVLAQAIRRYEGRIITGRRGGHFRVYPETPPHRLH